MTGETAKPRVPLCVPCLRKQGCASLQVRRALSHEGFTTYFRGNQNCPLQVLLPKSLKNGMPRYHIWELSHQIVRIAKIICCGLCFVSMTTSGESTVWSPMVGAGFQPHGGTEPFTILRTAAKSLSWRLRQGPRV